jgi:hypothetical protein
MRPATANHNSLGKLYHDQRASLKMRIIEDLKEIGVKHGKLGFWLREVSDDNLPNMPGNMRDVFIEHIPDSAKLLIITQLQN